MSDGDVSALGFWQAPAAGVLHCLIPSIQVKLCFTGFKTELNYRITDKRSMSRKQFDSSWINIYRFTERGREYSDINFIKMTAYAHNLIIPELKSTAQSFESLKLLYRNLELHLDVITSTQNQKKRTDLCLRKCTNDTL